MATVTGFTAERMLEIEDNSVVAGTVDGDGDLILIKHDGSEIVAGNVKGDPGEPGDPGDPGDDGIDGTDGAPGTIPPHSTVTSASGTHTLDATLYSDVTLVVTGDLIIRPPTGGVAGQRIIYEIVQNGTGGWAVALGEAGHAFGWSDAIPNFSPVDTPNNVSFVGIRYSNRGAGGWHVISVADEYSVF